MRVVERADGGLALVLNLLAVLQQREASLVGIAFLALGGAGDGHKVLLHGRTVRGAALLRGERGQHDRVIRFGGVREIGDLGVEGLDVLLEFLGRVGTWNGAGGALEQARVEVGGMVDGVAVGHVQLMGVEALGGELLDERHGLVEGDDERRVGVGGLDGRDHR